MGVAASVGRFDRLSIPFWVVRLVAGLLMFAGLLVFLRQHRRDLVDGSAWRRELLAAVRLEPAASILIRGIAP